MNFELQLIGICLCIYFFIVFQFLYFQKKNRRELEQKLKEEWGTYAAKKPDRILQERLIHDTQTHPSQSNKIDSITWNDLDMDSIFCQMNQTHSSIGEESLYHLLHTPIADLEALKERDRLITFFSSHEKERLAFEVLAESIGKQNNFFIKDDFFQPKDALNPKQPPKPAKHLAADLFLIGSLFLLLTAPIFGIFVLLFALTYSISLYYKEKAKVANEISCFKQTVSILRAVEKLTKFQAKELTPYLNPMKEAQESLILFKKLSSILLGGRSGSPLDIVLDYVRMLTHIDLILFGQIAAQFETHKKEIILCIEQFGFLESMIAAASYRKALPEYCLPEFLTAKFLTAKSLTAKSLTIKSLTEEKNQPPLGIELTEVYHPCIKSPIKNSIAVKKSVLLTGSNASGKSTFLKTTAIAALLAQTIYTVPATRYQAPFYQIFSSMAIRDNLSNHDSYYMAEIKSLKRILDAKKDTIPVLCFIDEVLRGTNTVERIAASTEILKSLSKQQVLCFAATHDIELTQLLNEDYENYYFSEEIQKEDIQFDYKLKKGISTSRNAIRLIQQIGYDETIVNRALLRADTFLKTGSWRKNL